MVLAKRVGAPKLVALVVNGGIMTINFLNTLAVGAGVALIVGGVGDYVRYHGVWGHPEPVPLADCWPNVVVAGLGVIILCFAAVLTSLAAIDKKLHE